MGWLWRRIGEKQAMPPWGIFTALAMAIGAFVSIVLGALIAGSFSEQSTTSILLAYCMGMGFTALLVTVMCNRTPADGVALAMGKANARIPLILMLSFGFGAVLDLLTLIVTGRPYILPEITSAGGISQMNQAGFSAWFLAGLLLLVLQPIAEGLVFRGVAYPVLRAILGSRAGFFMAAAWFGIFHMLAYVSASGSGDFNGLWVTAIVPIVIGLYLNVIRAATESTRISMIAQVGLSLFLLVRVFA